ncbi:MAG TPA: gas vesicle protein GvpG [Acidimicrobiales bacterium]|nr:gas vesicle protein GvpG [Acidimicrobiales bacterium]
MGLLIGLLTLPVSGPIRGTIWVAEQVRAAAERSWFDEAAIRRELADLDERHRAGEIDDEEHEEAADALIDRLLEAAAARERGVDLADEEDEADVVEVDEVAAGEEDGDA